MQRDFKGIWIPKEIWLAENLSLLEKVMLVEINSLDNEDGCFAGNEYFSEFFGITTVRVSQIIGELKEKGFVEQVSFDGRKRILKSSFKENFKAGLNGYENSFKENFKADLNIPLMQDQNLFKGSIKENDKYSNTNSNTLNNPINNKKPSAVSSVSIMGNLYLVKDLGLNKKIVEDWAKVDWNNIDVDGLEYVLRFISHRNKSLKPIKTASGLNGILNRVRGLYAHEIKKAVDESIDNDWVTIWVKQKKADNANKWGEAIKNVK